ncbi:hypothetical protein D3C81_888020 [compost metagenome]
MAWIDLASPCAICSRFSYSTASILLRPTISRTEVSAAWVTSSSSPPRSVLLKNRNSVASWMTYCTVKRTSMMFSSCVSIDESFRLLSLIDVERPTSTERTADRLTISADWTGQGSRQLMPGPVEYLNLPNCRITAVWPSCTMKKPLASQMPTTAATITPTPTPEPLPGVRGPPNPWLPPPPFSLRPSRPFRRRLKSRHSSSRSGGPPSCCGRWFCWRLSSRPSFFSSSSPLRPQRGSFSEKMARRRCQPARGAKRLPGVRLESAFRGNWGMKCTGPGKFVTGGF